MAKKKEPNVVELTPQELGGGATAFTTKKNDIVNITKDYDNVTITKSKGTDTLYFMGTTDINDLSFSRDGKDLIIERTYEAFVPVGSGAHQSFVLVEKTQTVRVEKYFANAKGTSTKSAVKFIRLDNGDGGMLIDPSLGTTDYSIIDDGLISSSDIGVEFKRSKKGLIKGTMFNDTIVGSTLNDKIKGGKGDDVLYGDTGNDKLYGGKGNDTYVFDTYSKQSPIDGEMMFFGSGTDTLMDAEKGDIIKFTTTYFEDLTFTKKGNDLVITYKDYKSDPDDVTKDATVVIKKYYKSKKPVDKVIALDGEGNLVEYSILTDAVVERSGKGKIVAGDSKDIINGSDGKDTIVTGQGDDVIKPGKGDDDIYLSSRRGLFGGYSDLKNIYIGNGDGNNTIYNAATGGFITLYFDSNTDDVSWDRVDGTDNMLVTRTYTDDNGVVHTETTLLEGVYKEGTEATVQYAVNSEYGYMAPIPMITKGTEYIYAADGQTTMEGNGISAVYQIDNGITSVLSGDTNDYYTTGGVPNGYQTVISDAGGFDSLNVVLSSKNFPVYFDIYANGETGSDLYILSDTSYVTSSTPDTGIKIENYFGVGNIESITYDSIVPSFPPAIRTNYFSSAAVEGLISTMVDWLNDNGFESTADVFALQSTDPVEYETMYGEMMNIFSGYNYSGDQLLNNLWVSNNPNLTSWEYDAADEHVEKYIINSEWGDDELSISTVSGAGEKHNLFFSVKATGEVGYDLYIDGDNSVIGAGLNPFSDDVTSGVLIENYFTRDGYIEEVTSQGYYTLTSGFFEGMVQDVVNWLNANGYESTDAVFEGGHEEDIAALMNVYINDSNGPIWQKPYDGPV